ncbi:response regulator [candidate division KSB1 bacterium]|nr:response regulator [candidate division KSB1 bacterium]
MNNHLIKILIADDDVNFRLVLTDIIKDLGYKSQQAVDGVDALEKLSITDFDLLLLDLTMPRMGGMDVLERLKEKKRTPEVIVVTSHATIRNAVEATKFGAFDFVAREEVEERLPVSIRNALNKRRLESENIKLKQETDSTPELLGESQPMQRLRQEIRKVALLNSTILIEGASGSGKELVAREIHVNSRLNESPLVTVNCSALPDTLVESELFGHVKGAFTNATSNKKGKFEIANDGTIFLDEIGDMSPGAQAKLLRVLETGDIQKVGATQPINVSVRVIAATNKNLAQEVSNRIFREDLYHRLNVIKIIVPALKDHQEDIPLLCRYFLKKYSRQNLIPQKMLTREALKELQSYSWPGNIRELRNLMERIAIMSTSETIDVWELHQWWNHATPKLIPYEDISSDLTLEDARRHFEAHYIRHILNKCSGNITKSAQRLSLNRSYLHEKIRELGI